MDISVTSNFVKYATPTLVDIPPDSVSLDDVDKLRSWVFESVKSTITSLPPVTYGNYSLKFENLEYKDPELYPIKKERDSIISGGSLYRRLYGDAVLLDNSTNKEIGRRRLVLARVPYMTRLGSFLLDGNAYSAVNQQRLRPGVYVRIKDNGEVEGFINLPHGLTHKYGFDPERGLFYMIFRQARVPILSLLRAMGVPDAEVRRAWGDKIFNLNVKYSKSKDVYRLFPSAKSQAEFQQALQEFLDKAKFDPEVVSITLGKPFENLNAEAIIRTTLKMLQVYKGEIDPDERDALFYQAVYGVETFLSEAISRFHPSLRKFILRAVRRDKDLSIIPNGIYDEAIRSVFVGSSLAELLEEINPGEIYDRLYRITKLGEGGISDPRAATDDARGVHPSQMGFIDPAITAAQMRSGVDNRISWLARRGRDGRIYTLFKDVRSGNFVWRSPNDLLNAIIAFPNELKSGKPFIRGVRNGIAWYYKPEDVDYELPYGEQYFTPSFNFIPAIGALWPHRGLMGQKMQLQALPLVNREAPLVQGKIPFAEESFQQRASQFYGAIISTAPGTVIKVTNDVITVKSSDGNVIHYELFNNYPFNRKTFIHNIPKVKEGDAVHKGQVLATSNFTDDSGVPAFGINAYTAFMPYKGYNYEDAYVISESFAKRLTSELMYQDTLEIDDSIITGKNNFRAVFPTKYEEKFYKNYDEDGVILPGKKISKGQPLILAVKRADFERQVGKKRVYSDASIVWDHEDDGEIIDVYKGRDYFYVTAKTHAGLIVGDKITGRFGDKGIVAKIVPDEEMPRDSEGRIFDLIINPLALESRTNPAQIYEMLLGKIAASRGKPYLVPAFSDDFYRYVDGELRANGIKAMDTVYDPTFNLHIPHVLTGYKYVMKLHHMAESKLQERDFGAGYTSEGAPARGGKEGAKRIGLLELSGLLGHNAFHVIRDAKMIRGQENSQFWFEFMRGGAPLLNKDPFVYDKFLGLLKGMGINVVSDGRYLHMMALSNRDVRALTGDRRIENPETVRLAKDDIKIIPGGLYDEKLTGGLMGRAWSYIELPEPMPSPVMQEAIQQLLGITENEFRQILAGKMTSPRSGIPGPAGLKKALEDYDVDREAADVLRELKTASDSKRRILTRKLRYLLNIRKTGIHPSEWFWDRIPVIPPAFRPISSSRGTLVIADVNALYQDAFEAAEILRQQKDLTDDLSDAYLALYDSMKAIADLGEPIQAIHRQQKISGLLQQIMGPTVKFNYVLRKLISPTTDLTGRAVISPNPNLDIDTVALPVDMAWILFKPFIIRRLVKRGLPLIAAINQYNNRGEYAREALNAEMASRVVIMNRAPVLHKFGVMAFKPILTQNKVVEINPQVIFGFGADFDGDAVQIHVPVSDEAQKEAKELMLPSKNYFSAASDNILYPADREYLIGLWFLSQPPKNTVVKKFSSKPDAIRAYFTGKISYDTPVEVPND